MLWARIPLLLADLAAIFEVMLMSPAEEKRYTLGEVARTLGCDIWYIRRLYERNLLPPAERVGTYRVVRESDLPKVREALKKAGYVK